MAADRAENLLGTPLWLAILVHIGLGGALVISTLLSHRGENWGGPGGSVNVGIVGGVPAIPLPRPEEESPSRVVDNSKGLYKAKPPEIAPPPPNAVALPQFRKTPLPPPPRRPRTRPKETNQTPPPPKTHPSRLLENNTPPPQNAIPYGQSGTPTVPVSTSTTFTLGSGSTQAGLSFNGTAGGDFASRFSWYVEAVQRRISGNWLQSTIDPGVSSAPEVTITFTIARDGSISNVQTHSSGNPSVDNSAYRAVRDSSPLPELPPEYSGSYVNVEFKFDFRR